MNIWAIGIGSEIEQHKDQLECLKIPGASNTVEIIFINDFEELYDAFKLVTDNCANQATTPYDGQYEWNNQEQNG